MAKRPPPPPPKNVSGGFSRGIPSRIPAPVVPPSRPVRSNVIPARQVELVRRGAPLSPPAFPVAVLIRDAAPPLKILVRMPTRSRPAQALDALARYRRMAGMPVAIEVVVDDDDVSMATPAVRRRLAELGCTVTAGKHKSKVEAVNAGRVTDWDVLVLASDDMVPIVDGWALHVERDMRAHFPQLDGALHYNDGFAGEKLCTLPIQGRRLYAQFGYVYAPQYKSLWCDNEQTDVLRSMQRLVYLPTCIIKHQHPAADKRIERDALYERNEATNVQDRQVYQARKARNFDAPKMRLSILIATLPSREAMLRQLLDHIWAQALLHPREAEVLIDAGDGSVGVKRQRLLGRARGEFIAFVDDDDRIADNYIDRVFTALDATPVADCVEFHVAMLSGGTVYKGHCSIKHKEWETKNGVFVRCPNHLSPVRRSLALRAGFPDKTFGEDYDYSMRLLLLLKIEAPTSPEPFYFYRPSSEPPITDGGAA